ncbi:hypothetical protein [Flavobacterium sp. MDT1-60]|uniref:hypothetical protein n=1 Tax=Flavobacterium sp. MDT1-60 TaxID=1979344 RepID=UPI00178749E5|nr:hypothetical protein [Flavobacterium sp. MDT1-60]QOG01227.1 hypothetical protein IHE43_15580 [Flavobacterium sp. MDT1-60]
MKTLLKLKIAFVILITGLLFSCKNNKDGYSDEIDTRKTPLDTAAADTTNINNGPNTTGTNSTGATGTESEGVTGAGSISAPGKPNAPGTSTKGAGTGPGPSAKDGSVYDISSQTKKDTTKLGAKALAKEKRSKQ